MRDYDSVNKAQTEAPSPMMQEAGAGLGQSTLLNRLHQRRRHLEMELQRVCNSIEFVKSNQALVDVVEIVLASRDKCDPRPIGY